MRSCLYRCIHAIALQRTRCHRGVGILVIANRIDPDVCILLVTCYSVVDIDLTVPRRALGAFDVRDGHHRRLLQNRLDLDVLNPDLRLIIVTVCRQLPWKVVQSSESNRKGKVSRWRKEVLKKKDRDRKRKEMQRKKACPHGGIARKTKNGVTVYGMMKAGKNKHQTRRKDAVRKYITQHVPGTRLTSRVCQFDF